jgi:chromate transporter
MNFLQLYLSFFKIGLFSFGGGYATLPLIEEEIVNVQGFLTYQQFIDLLVIAEITPGPIGINSASFAGHQVAGWLGATVATLGVVTPAITLVLLLGYLFQKYQNLALVKGFVNGLRPASVALIASAAVTIVLTAFFGQTSLPVNWADFNWLSLILFLGSLYLLQKYNINTLKIILLTGLIGGIFYSVIG